ncbi:MAG: hypothetical protein AB8I08_10300 [Sandaracinaceae bacterium]
MSVSSPSVHLVAAILAGLASGCVVPNLLEDRPCPCAAGWSCDEPRNVCVRSDSGTGSDDSGSSPADAGPGDAGPGDAGPGDAGPADAVPTTCWVDATGCDWSEPGSFAFFEDDGTALSNVAVTGNAILSPDGCSLYYESDGEVFVAERPNGTSPFGLGRSVGAINTSAPEVRGTESPDGRELLFVRVAEVAQVFRARRGDRAGAWDTGAPVDILNDATSDSFDVALSPRGLDVYMTRVAGAVGRIFVAQRAALADEFGVPTPLADFAEGGSVEAEPSVTADDRVIVIIRSGSGETERQAHYAIRNRRGEAFGDLTLVPGAFFELDREEDVSVSPDGCELFVLRRGRQTRLTYQPR